MASVSEIEVASELEVVPLSSGIDDIDKLHKPQSHPLALSIHHNEKKKNQIVVNLQNKIRDKLKHKHINGMNNEDKLSNPNQINKPIIGANNYDIMSKQLSPISPSTPSALTNYIKILAPSIGFFGCQFAWACQGGYVDPYLRQLGLPDDMMNYAWILGPISGTDI